MILSSPFSRQHKSHQTWHHAAATPNGTNGSGGLTNGHSQLANGYHVPPAAATAAAHKLYSSTSLRRPAPQQPAPQRPAVVPTQNGVTPPRLQLSTQQHATTTPTSTIHNNRASTLNRLDLLKRRQQQQVAGSTPSSAATATLRRNLSSLGHYPAEPTATSPAARRPQIYAPASIASPRELDHQQQQHYASTSVRNHPVSSRPSLQRLAPTECAIEPGDHHQRPPSTRPESALGQLWERFGTLRRKSSSSLSSSWRRAWPGGRSSWSRASSRRTTRADTPHSQIYAPASIAGYPSPQPPVAGGESSATTRRLAATGVQVPLAPGQPLVLDPEIYAAGKRPVEPEAIYAEGSHALDSNAERRLLEHQLLEPGLMSEGETRTLVEEASARAPDFRRLVTSLTGWINDELAQERILVRDLADDLHDGQVLCKLVEKLAGLQLDLVEVTQNELVQRHKLQTVLAVLGRQLVRAQRMGTTGSSRWTVEGIHGKNLVEILHLLVAMALFYRAPLRLPANVSVQVLVFQKHQGELVCRQHQVELTDASVTSALDRLAGPGPQEQARQNVHLSTLKPHPQRGDAFDALLESAPPAKLELVKQSLVRFCNRHLAKINMSCCQVPTSNSHSHSLDPHQFSDGLLLVFLISTLEDYFVPLGNLFTSIRPRQPKTDDDELAGSTQVDANNNNNSSIVEGQATALEPTSFVNTQPIEKLHNVNLALQLMEDAGLADIRRRVRAEEIVNGDLKALLRLLYTLFSRYKHL